MLPDIKILDEKKKVLHKKCSPVDFPLNKEEKRLIKDSLEYLRMSQIEEYSEKYHLRPGMGLAFPQLGITKRIFVICNEVSDGKFEDYVIINPRILSHSEEEIYVEEGEGCLSVNREVDGIVPRYARVKVEAYDENGEKHTYRVREDLAVAFQHEIDHLDGIIFTDKIDPKDPYKNMDQMRPI